MSRPTEISTYNPHLLGRDDLVASFIARGQLLDELVEDLRGGANQHHLLVGARGAGKTTLLLRLAVAIEEDKKLARKALPLRFPEEQYNVAQLSDFWLNCLDALTDVLEARGDHEGKRKLEVAVASIATLPEPARTEASLSKLLGWASSARKMLVLLVDNFDLILDRLRDAQWPLREALSRDNGLVLIGATSRFVEDAIAYDSPLYDFFRVRELGQVTEEEARRVVIHLAKLRGHSHIEQLLEEDPGRFKALYVLTGGIPRMLVLLSSVLARDGASVDSDLEQMLDQLTPYYKARFDELPAQSQLVVDAVALHWHPMTAAQCAERTRLDVKVVSAQLARLVQHGLVTKTALPNSSKLGFLITERFFNIWYLMRSSRRVRRRLAWFVEFLRMWYGEEELARRARRWLDVTPEARDPERMLALASTISDVALRRRVESRATGMLLERIRLDEIHELLDLDGVDAHLAPIVDRAKTLKQLRAHIASKPKLARLGEAIINSPLITLAMKVPIVERLVARGLKPAIGTEVLVGINGYRSLPEARVWDAISRGEIPSLPDVATHSDVEAVLELAQDRVLVSGAVLLYTQRQPGPGADEVFRSIVKRGPEYRLAAFQTFGACITRIEWTILRHRIPELILTCLHHEHDREWVSGLADFLQGCVRHERALDMAVLLEESELAEPLAPLIEALKLIETNTPLLDHLAPEIRALAEEIHTFLRRSKEQTSAPPSSSGATPRRGGRHGRASGDRGATRRRPSRRRGRAAIGASRRGPARRR